jgi:hypothetical protein
MWPPRDTPFDRAADARPLLRLAVDVDAAAAADAPGTERALALAELPFLDVRAIRGGRAPSASYDLLVTGAPGGGAPGASGPVGAVRPAEALDLVRLLLVHHRLFQLRGGARVDATLYHVYRVHSLFRAYRPASAAATYGKGAINAAVRAQLGSLGTRLGFVCRAADRGAYAALRRADNDSEDEILYHLGYFVMLATGVFDDLAWTLKYQYRLTLAPVQVTLKPPKKPTAPASLLVDALRAVPNEGAAVAARVADPAVQALVRVFYPIRDQLQHRQFLSGCLVFGGPWGVPKILFEFPEEVIPLLRAASADGTGAEWGLRRDDAWVDPYAFITRALAALVTVHEAVLGAVDWPALVGALGEQARDAADGVIAQSRASLARFLGWPAEPLYF